MTTQTTGLNHKVSIRKSFKMIAAILKAGHTPLLLSSPGIGKTSTLEMVAKEANLKYINFVASTSEPTDVGGYPFVVEGEFKLLSLKDIFPTEDMEVPQGSQGWLLNLDEFTSCEPDMQAAFYKVIHERRVGQAKLHPRVCIAMTGNYLTDNAVVNPLSTAMWSRVVTLHIEANAKEWIEDYGVPNKFDPMLLAFILNNNLIVDFDPSKNIEGSFCCPRTWKTLNDLIVKNGGWDSELLPIYAGTITPGVAVNLDNFYSIAGEIITIDEILADPENARIENRINLQWATAAQIMNNITEDNAADLFKYTLRMNVSMRVLVFKVAKEKLPNLFTKPEMVQYLAMFARATL